MPAVVNDYSVLMMSLGFLAVFSFLVVLWANNSSAVVTLPTGTNTTLATASNITGTYHSFATTCNFSGIPFLNFVLAIPSCILNFWALIANLGLVIFILIYLYPILLVPLGVDSIMLVYVGIKLARGN